MLVHDASDYLMEVCQRANTAGRKITDNKLVLMCFYFTHISNNVKHFNLDLWPKSIK